MHDARTVYTAVAMSTTYRTFPFRRVLPLAQLVLCVSILGPYWPSLAYQFVTSFKRSPPPESVTNPLPPEIEGILLTPDFASNLGFNSYDFRMTAPAALNLPVGFLQIPYVIANPAKTEWVPRGMFFKPWRALSWPVFGMLFWWMSGRGLEAIAAARRGIVGIRIRWLEVIVALPILVLGSGVGIMFAIDKEARWGPAHYLLAVGGVLWAFLGVATVTAGLLQWRLHRKEKRQAQAQAV